MTDTTTMDQQEQVARIERMQEENRALAPWQVAIGGMTAGAALFGAGAAFTKFVIG